MNSITTKLPIDEGLLFYLIKQVRPELAKHITKTKKIDTMIVGLGNQGTRHAGLMIDYGTEITCGVAPGRGGTLVHEKIPVYNNSQDAIKNHPDIAVASIWRHYSSAKDAVLEVIKTGIPIIVLISEFIPLRDVRDILVETRKHNTLLFGGNTPGIIFPPENIKVGMLPDIFQPENINGKIGSKGVTVISRSGAILYHLSDALASAGISQNAVLGIGGDGAIGSRFIDLVSLVMGFDGTELVVIAGEIGGMQEELLAQDIKTNPDKYSKPLVALISGSQAPEGKTMGHAGAVVAPGQSYGTHLSKKTALENAGVIVVNHQHDLINEVKQKLKRSYFDIDDYFTRMKEKWAAKPPSATWGTLITNVLPNNLLVRGYPLQEIIANYGFLESTHLISEGKLPSSEILTELENIAISATLEEGIDYVPKSLDLSKNLGTFLLTDAKLSDYSRLKKPQIHQIVYTLGRVARYFAILFDNQIVLADLPKNISFSQIMYSALTGENNPKQEKIRLLEAMITACIDHGVTPPSAQATLILSSVRPMFEVALATGTMAITDVHGGAGQKAAEFFQSVIEKAELNKIDYEEACFQRMRDVIKTGERVEGLGHRIHTQDPRRDVLWDLAKDAGYAKECVAVSKIVSESFYRVRGMNLPINVDGVIGAIVADMNIDTKLAKGIFIYGRIAGLAAHYFEEIHTQTQMRRINFEQVIYKGSSIRKFS
ncbi:MAG: Succinyl-CoA ligase [ADP-forming] subunit alpha [Candidatus Heimdallarchaeota archaeon LC_2]|nr:MAG: Succinyl-CoA ligase [ADP-forming] subunit alpha [Candidatus Heimdallarchaeota archaeon LC_2]